MSSIPISPALSRPRSPSLPCPRFPPPSSGPPTTKREREREERLINAYEAEEERIINVLSRKLEQLREEKITLERVHEEEDEARVNRLARELAVLRVRQHQQQQQQYQQAQHGPQHVNGAGSSENGGGGSISEDGLVGLDVGTSSGLSATATLVGSANVNGGLHAMNRPNGIGPPDPSSEVLLNALKKENENLRNRLGTVEREYVRLTRLNEVYREELIQHRRRLGISVDNLIGLSNATDAYSQPTHRRGSSAASTSSNSPTASMVALPSLARPSSTTHSVPIPRPSAASASRRAQTLGLGAGTSAPMSIPESPLSNPSSAASTSASVSASASPDLSPVLSALPASYASGATHLTTPPSSASLRDTPPAPYGTPGASSAVIGLSYPSVPPPSLSSSLGSPVVLTHHIPSPGPVPGQGQGHGHGQGQRHSQGQWSERRFSQGPSHSQSHSQGQGSRRTSVERGARIAETGSLVRSRAGSSSGTPASASHTHTHSGLGNADGMVFVPSLDETRESE
ncbi:hypothetical protein ACEPAH_1951 [Sanghuangporus vaninii]